MRATYLLGLCGLWCVDALVEGPWSDSSASSDIRATQLLQQMTLDEKLAMLHGPDSCFANSDDHRFETCPYVGNIKANERLGIPPLYMNDGPSGFRDDMHHGSTTSWPSGLNMAATFDKAAVFEWASGMGKEFYQKGANVFLGPGVNVMRVPRGGRTFEYITGEDPYLGHQLVQPAVKGIQSQKVMANVKHWVLNSQETDRQTISENADERTRMEIYYPPFDGAIQAGAVSFMCSYNKIDGVYSCEQPKTLIHDLREELNFKGFVLSDWGATKSAAIEQGLDMEMGAARHMNPKNLHTKDQEVIDRSVHRILYGMFEVGIMDLPLTEWDINHHHRNVSTDEAAASARKLAALSTVLLKNEKDMLPLKKDQHIALIGLVTEGAIIHGIGSSCVEGSYHVSPLEGIRAAAGNEATVDYVDGKNLDDAEEISANADVAIVFVGTLSTEGLDRKSLSLDDGCTVRSGVVGGPVGTQCRGNIHHQNQLVQRVVKANRNTVVVASVPGPILMPWSRSIPAILTNFLPGQQAGNAIADILFGEVNPSAKLPVTFPNKENELDFHDKQWPGIANPAKPATQIEVEYSEKLLVGYRYYDAKNIQFTTGFPFGHGLSYTTFEYSDLQVDEGSVTFSVANTGKVPGAEVAQVYLGFPKEAGEPPQQLRGFHKTAVLKPGEGESVTISLTSRDLSIWNVDDHGWVPVKGVFKVNVGSSSRDIRLKGTFESGKASSFLQVEKQNKSPPGICSFDGHCRAL